MVQFQSKLHFVTWGLLVVMIATFLGVLLLVDVETQTLLKTVNTAVGEIELKVKDIETQVNQAIVELKTTETVILEAVQAVNIIVSNLPTV